MKKLITTFLILPVLCLILFACGGSAIGDAQEFSPNEAPSILSIKAVNFDGSEMTQLDIEPYKQFKLIVEAVDPDNNPLEYKFDSESGTFAGISSNPKGCTAVFKTGSIKGGQNIELWAMVSDGKGALVRQSYNLGTGKLGPTIVASFEKIIFRPVDKIKLSVSANCSGFFQLYCNGNGKEKFDFEKDMYRYSYGPNKTTDFILAGPNCTSHADIVLEAKPGCVSDTDYESVVYNLVLVFRDGLFQENSFPQIITVDGTPPQIKDKGFSFVENPELAPEVKVIFDEKIGYADSSCLKLEPAGGNVKLLRISGNTVYFTVTGLKSLIPYTATISGIKDIAGNVMVPDSTNSFMTKYSGSSKFVVYDKSAGMSFTSYRGFEDKTLTLTSNQGEDFTCESSDAGIVEVNQNNAEQITVKTHDYALTDKSLNTDRTVTITATSGNGEKAYFVVTIKPWYPVTKASEFGQGEIIDQNLNGRFRLENNIDFKASNISAISPIGYYLDVPPETAGNRPFTGIFDGNRNKNFKLSNIILKASEPIVPNGGGINAGIFAYNMGTITNLVVISATYDNSLKGTVGIICAVNQGTISNCKVIDLEITATSYAGGIAGYNFGVYEDGELIGGIISECEVTGKSNINAATGYSGGFVGSMKGGKIEGSSSYCEIDGGTGDCVGGLVGDLIDAEVINCHSTGNVIGYQKVGGLVGMMSGTTITGTKATSSSAEKYSYSTGSVTGYLFVGGLVGYCSNGTVSKSYHEVGTVGGNTNVGGLIGFMNNLDSPFIVELSYAATCNVTGLTNVGGLIGGFHNNSGVAGKVDVDQCFANTTVAGSSNNIGGLIGYLNFAEITDCFSRGRVEGSENIGGLIGYVDGGSSKVERCYSVARVFSKNSKNYGELIGNVNSAFVNSSFCANSYYWEDDVISIYGQGKSIDQLKVKDTYTGWSISDIDILETTWWIDSKPSNAVNGGFPYLRLNPPK